MDTLQRIPPQNLDAERAVLGSCLIDPAVVARAAVVLAGREDFYREAHRDIWDVMLRLHTAGQPVDVLSVSTALREQKHLERIGGGEYLTTLMDAVPSTVNADYYAGLIRAKAARRAMISVCATAMRTAWDEEVPVEQSAAQAVNELLALQFGTHTSSLCRLDEALTDFLARLDRGPTRLRDGVKTHLHELDTLTRGLAAGELSYWTGRPASGKTTLAVGCATSIALHHGPVLYVTYETLRQRIIERLVAMTGRFPASVLGYGPADVLEATMPAVAQACSRLAGIPLYLLDATRGRPSTATIRAVSQGIMAREEKPLSAVFIDRFEFIGEPRGKRESDYEHATRKSELVKEISTSIPTHVACLVQMNREAEKRPDKRPVLSDLRMTGGLEQDAQIVIGIYREEYYHPKPSNKGLAELLILKNNDGPTGTAHVEFRGEIPAFYNVLR